MIPILNAALSLASGIVAHLPAPDPAIRRARILGHWSAVVARLEAVERVRPLTPAEVGRLARGRAMVAGISGGG